jgi:hypothetical protein
MTIDQTALDRFVVGIRPPVVAVTTHFEGRDNGQIILSGGAGSVIPEAMRMSIVIWPRSTRKNSRAVWIS